MLSQFAPLAVKFSELRSKIPDLVVVNSDVFLLVSRSSSNVSTIRARPQVRSGNRFPFHAVEVVLEAVKRSLTENVVQPLFHVLTEVLDVQRRVATVDEEALRNGWREQRFNRTNGLQPMFTCKP